MKEVLGDEFAQGDAQVIEQEEGVDDFSAVGVVAVCHDAVRFCVVDEVFKVDVGIEEFCGVVAAKEQGQDEVEHQGGGKDFDDEDAVFCQVFVEVVFDDADVPAFVCVADDLVGDVEGEQGDEEDGVAVAQDDALGGDGKEDA